MTQSTRAHHEFDYRLFIVGIFLLLFALGTGEDPVGDPGARLTITKQLIIHGRLHVADPDPRLVQTPMGWTSYFGIGQTLLFIPFELAGKALALFPPTGFAPGMRRDFPLTYLYCPLVGVAYFLALISLLKAFGLCTRAAAITATLFTFSSLSAHYIAQSFQDEAITSVFVCLSLAAALHWRHSGKNRYAFAAGLLFASMLLFRSNAIFVLIPVALLFAQGLRDIGLSSVRARRAAGAVLLGVLGPAGVHFLFVYLRFGNLLSTGYDHADLVLWQPLQFEVVRSLLFGLGKGLFIFSPMLGIALWEMWIDRAKLGLYGMACLGALAGSVILSTAWHAPDGCWSWGTRFQVHLLPLFAYPAWLGMRDLLGRRIGIPLVSIAVGLGLFFQLCALLASDRLEYSQVGVTQGWKRIQNDQERVKKNQENCRLVQERQFAMRLENTATVIHAVVESSMITDEHLRSKFGNFWVVRLGRSQPAWVRNALLLAWLGILLGALTCLYRAFRRKRSFDSK